MEALTRIAERDPANVIAAAAAGDEEAFQRIIAEHHDAMRRVCAFMARDEAVADEATHAAWAIAWKKIGSIRQPDSLRPWLMTIAVNEAKRLVRKRKRRAEIEVTIDASNQPGGIDPATGVGALDLRSAMARLDPDDRALLALRYGAGFTAVELGLATGRSSGATRQRLKRLLDRLREDLDHG
jgi:RNA polymerase sigma-70 factor (ECF subfamily)